MSVADEFGLDDPAAPLYSEARVGWGRWCAADPIFAVVDEIDELRGWMRTAPVEERAAVVARLAALAASDRSAVAALVWLLIPGACRIARALQDLSSDIDALVASELWVQASRAHELTTPWIARAVLGETRREVEASLGVGRRAERVWRQSVLTDRLDLAVNDTDVTGVTEDALDPAAEVWDFLDDAVRDGVVELGEVSLLLEVATAADDVDAPLRRGRAGLTTPAVADRVARGRSESARTVRRRVSRVLDLLAEYASRRTEAGAA
ncbi:MAG: hypothetical protein ACRDS9_28750 [Pseudonocardiaceae bacterium]